MRTAMLLAFAGNVLAAQQQSTSELKVVHLSPEVVDVAQQGRVLGKTPRTFKLTAGVQRLQIGKTDHCVYLSPGAVAEIVLSDGRLVNLTGALTCEDAWTEISLLALPTPVVVRSSAGASRRQGRQMVVRVPLPGRISLTIEAPQQLAFSTEVTVGPKEVVTYRARLGPLLPPLTADSVLERLPAEPTAPPAPTYAAEPVDPAIALTNAENRFAILRSAKSNDKVAKFGAIVFLAGGVASLVTGGAVANDSLKLKPELRPPFHISLGVMGSGLVIMYPAQSSAARKGTRANCESGSSARTDCLRTADRDVERLRDQASSFPMRRTTWAADRARIDSTHRVATAEYVRRRQTWIRLTAEAEQRNQRVTRNRAENQRVVDAWRERARAAQGLDLVSRTARP